MDSAASSRAIVGSLALAAVLVACGSDGIGPLVDAAQAPSLSVTLHVAADGLPAYDVSAAFSPGRDAGGQRRRIANDTLYVDDRAIPAQTVSGSDTLFYDYSVALPPVSGRATVRLRGPQIADGGAAQLDLPLPRRPAGEEVALPPGTDLSLSIEPPAAVAAVATVAKGWRVALQRACAGTEYLAVSGPGAPTYRHEIGWSMVASMPADSLAACASSTYDFTSQGAPYRVTGTVGARVRWFIRVVR
jgi:hypothetical protein